MYELNEMPNEARSFDVNVAGSESNVHPCQSHLLFTFLPDKSKEELHTILFKSACSISILGAQKL